MQASKDCSALLPKTQQLHLIRCCFDPVFVPIMTLSSGIENRIILLSESFDRRNSQFVEIWDQVSSSVEIIWMWSSRKNSILWVETFSRDTLLQKPPAQSWWHQHHASTERLSLAGDGSRCLADGFNPTAVLASWVLWSRKTRPSQSLILILEPTDVGYTDGKRLYVCKYWETYLNL